MDLNLLKKELFGESTTGSSTPSQDLSSVDWDGLIDKYSQQYPNVPKNVMRGILEQESNFGKRNTGEMTRHGTAKGPWQFIDSTAKEFIPGWQSPEDSYDPEKSTAGAFKYIDTLIKETGDVKKAVGRYLGRGYDPVAKLTPDQYAGQVLDKAGYKQDPTQTTQKQPVAQDPNADFIKRTLFGDSSVQQSVPEPQPAMQPITGEQQPQFGGVIPEKVAPPQKKPGFFQDAGNALTAGAGEVTSGFYSIPAGITSIFLGANNLLNKGINAVTGRKLFKDDFQTPEMLTDNKLVQIPKQVAEEARSKISTKDQDLVELVKKGDVGGAAKFLGNWVFEQVPQQAMTMGTLLAGVPNVEALTLMGLTVGGSKEVENAPKVRSGEITQEQSSLSVAGNIGFEVGGEAFGDIPVADALKKAFAKKASEVGVEAAKETLGKTFQRVLKGYFSAVKQEVPSEVVTTIGQALTDKYSGVTPDLTAEQLLSQVITTAAGTSLMGQAGALTGLKESNTIRAGQKQQEAVQSRLDADPNFQRAMNAPDLTGTIQPIVDMQGYRDRMRAEQVQGDESIAGKIASEQQQPEVEIPEGLKPEPAMKPIAQQPEEDTGSQEITATEDQINTGKALAVNNGNVVFQRSNNGLKATNPNTGEKIERKPTFDFKDKESGYNFTLTEEELNEEGIAKGIEKVKERVAVDKKFREENGLTPTAELDAEDKASKQKKNKKEIKRKLSEAFLETDDHNEAFKKAGYRNIEGFWVHPDVSDDYINKISPEVKGKLKEESFVYFDSIDEKGKAGHAGGIVVGDKTVKGISVNSNLGENWAGHDKVTLHELGHEVWENLPERQKEEFMKRELTTQYAKDVKDGKVDALDAHQEEFSELYAENKGDVNKIFTTDIPSVQPVTEKQKESTVSSESEPDSPYEPMLIKLIDKLVNEGKNEEEIIKKVQPFTKNISTFDLNDIVYPRIKQKITERDSNVNPENVGKTEKQEESTVSPAPEKFKSWEWKDQRENAEWRNNESKRYGITQGESVEVGGRKGGVLGVRKDSDGNTKVKVMLKSTSKGGVKKQAEIVYVNPEDIGKTAKQEESTVSPAPEKSTNQNYIREKVENKVVKIPVKESTPFTVKGSKHEYFIIKRVDPYDGKDTYDLIHKETGARLTSTPKVEQIREMMDANSSSLGMEKFDEAIQNMVDKVKGEEVEAPQEMTDLYMKSGFHPRSYLQLEEGINDKNPNVLESILHLRNKKTRELFTAKTGVKLPGTMKGTVSAIREFVGAEKYDNIQKSSKEAALKKEEEEKKIKYNTERDKLLDAKIVYNGTPTTYRGMIDDRIKDGWKVEVEQKGIRQIYRLSDGENTVTLPKKMMGEYAQEQYLKKQEDRDKEIENKIPESERMTDKDYEDLFGKKQTGTTEKIVKGDEVLYDISGKGNFFKGKVIDETEETYTIRTTGNDVIFKTKDLVKPDPGFKRPVEELNRKNADTDVKLPGYEDKNFVARKREGFWWLYDKDSNEIVYGGDEFPFPSKESLIESAKENYKPAKKNYKPAKKQTGATENKLESTNNIKEKTDEKEVSQKTEAVLNEKVETPSYGIEQKIIEKDNSPGLINTVRSYTREQFIDFHKAKISKIATDILTSDIEKYSNDYNKINTEKELKRIAGAIYDKVKKEIDNSAPKKSVKERAQEKLRQKVAEENKGTENKKGYGLHLIENPNGTYGFVGSVPTDLMFEDGATQKDIDNAKQFGEKFGPKKRIFKTADEARSVAKEKGYEFDDKTNLKSQQEFTIAKDKAASAVDKMKKLLSSLETRDPNTLYSIGTEQMEIGFEIVSDLVDAGIHTFKGMVEFIRENLPDALKNAEFKKVIEMSYDSYYEVAQEDGDNRFQERKETVDNLSKEEEDDGKGTGSIPEKVETEGIGRDEQGSPDNEGTSSDKAEPGKSIKAGRGRDESTGSTRNSGSTDDTPSARRGDRIDFIITDESGIGEGGSSSKANDTIAAIRTLKKIESEGRTATAEEQTILAKFSGWGPLSGALNENMVDVPMAMKKYSEELRKLLTPEEWETAKISRETSHFTSVPVIRSVWDTLKRMGFKGGKVLEPSIGVGSFIGLRPVGTSMEVTGIEMDALTSRFAKHLYQTSNINNQKFEEYTMPKDCYDVVVSNVPFRDVPTFDKNADRYGIKNRALSLHNFFFAKALYGTRPGGVVAFITTHNTLDATKNKEHLKYITERGNILGAVRLPNTAFKGVAGTEVVTDIIFVQKSYPKESTRTPNNELFMQVGKVEGKGSKGADAFAYINKYFIDNPSMVVGENSFSGSMYGPDEYTVEPFDSNFEQDLRKALGNIPSDVIDDGETFKIKQAENIKVTPAPDDVMVGSFYELGDEIYIKAQDITQDVARGEKVTIQTKDKSKVKDLISIRNDARSLFKKQLGGNEDVSNDIKKLTKKYDDFVKAYGYFHKKENYRWIDQDVDMSILLALENYNPDTKTATKGDLLTKPIASRPDKVTKTDSIEDAYLLSLTEKGLLNVDYITELTGRSKDEVVKEMLSKKIIYEDPEIFNVSKTSDPSYIDRETYLSGNVRKKLKVAEAAAKEDSRFNGNVEDLKKVIPVDKGPGEIVLLPNNPVVQEMDIENFVKDILLGKRTYDRVVVSHNRETGKHKIFYEGGSTTNNNFGVTYTDTDNIAYTGTQLLELILNNNPITVTYTVKDGGSVRTVTDDKATQVAREKADKIRSEFKRWVWTDGERTDRLVRDFNDRYNCLASRKYTHPKRIKDPKTKISLVGNVISLRPHQSDVVWRGIQNKNLLMAHEVGAGKTFACISLAMELKRLGLRKKSMVVVPNHIADSWGKSILQAYPGAKVLVSNETNFSATKRKEFINKAAFNDYDIIVMRYSHFKEISMNPQYEAEFIQERVEKLLDALAKQKETEGKAGKGRRSATREEKNLQKRIDRYLGRVNDLLSVKRDVGIPYFDEMGVDQLFVDEADNFKNLEYVSTIKGILGMGKQDGSKQAIDLQMKTKHIQRAGGGVVFATGTPISNSLVEAFHMMTFLQSDYLEENGISNFDEWQRLYAEPVTSFEQNASGTGLKQRTRFTKYNNVQELITTLSDVWDIVDQQFLEENGILRTGHELPKVKRVIVESPINPYLADYMDHLAQREKNIANRKGPPEPGDDIVPVVTFHGKLASTALRAINKKAPFDKNEKLNKAINKAQELYNKYPDKAGIIFYDMSAPSKKKSVGLEVLSYMKEQLIASGVKPEEIALIHDFKKKELEEKLYKPMREGKIRILIGNTQRMGAGTNVQDKLKWLFHIDAPYRPRDIIQREGRIIRQGNFNDEVEIYTFITKGSLDSGSWELLSRKAKMINSVMSGRDKKTNTIDEGDQFSDVSIAAILSPLMNDRADLNLEIKRTNALNENLQSDIFYAKRKVGSAASTINAIEQRIKMLQAGKVSIPEKVDESNFKVQIVNSVYKDKKDAIEALDSVLSTIKDSTSYQTELKIGDYFGTPIEIIQRKDNNGIEYSVYATFKGRSSSDVVGYAKSSQGIINHITNTLRSKYDTKIKDEEKSIQNIEEETKLANETLKEDPNKYVKQLEEMNKRMLDLNAKIEEDQKRRQEERAQNASKIKNIDWYALEAERGDKSVAGEDEKDVDDEEENAESESTEEVKKPEPVKEEVQKVFDAGNKVKAGQVVELAEPKKYYNQKNQESGRKFILIEDAKHVDIGEDVDAFVYNDKTRKKGDTWIVVEATSGMMFGHGATKNEAVEGAVSAYTSAGIEKFKTVIRKQIEENGGLSPRYRVVEGSGKKQPMASAPLELPKFKLTDLAKPITPEPVKVDPVKSVRYAPSGKKMEYAKASQKLGNQITSKQNKADKDTGFLTRAEDFYKKWVDLSFPISKVEDVYDKDMGVSREAIREIDVAIDRVRGSGGIAKQFIDDNLKPIFDAITEKKGEVSAELSKYLVAKRTVWLYENKKNYIDLGVDKDSAQSFVEFVETGAHQYSKIIQESSGKIWEYGKKLLQVKKDHGIVDDALLGNLQEPYYVPFYRNIQDEKIARSVPRGERFTTISKGIKRIKGSLSGKQIIDPVQNLMEHTYETMVNAHRADVANMLITMAEESEAVGEMFHKVDPKWVRVGTIEHRGEIDLVLRPQIEELAKELGVTTEYKTKLATRIGGRLKKVLGQYREGSAIDLLVGATEGTYAHELGHAIHDRNEWYDNLVEKYDKELNAVADSRHEGTEAPQSYVTYCRSKPEKAAEFISMYITDRKALKKHVPEMLVEFEKKIAKDPTLKKLVGMKPSNIKGINSVEEDNFVQDWHIPQDADVISVLRDGKIVSYRVPIEVADAVKNLHPVMFPMWFKVLMTPNRILRKAAVTWNVDFMFPNSFRDQQESAINARSIPAYDWFIGLKEYAFNGDWFKRYHRAGGSMESAEAGVRGFSKSAEDLKYGSAYGKYLDQYYWQETGALRGSAAIAWEVMKFPFKAIEILGEASEMASRVGTFRRAQVGVPKWLEWYTGKKKTEEQAMHIARQATLDFQRFGSYGRSLNEIVPFINAAIQGTDKMVRTFKDDYKRAILMSLIYSFTPMIGLWLWNEDKEGYAAIPLQEKLNNFIIMHPDGINYFKIPKGHITKFVVNPFQIALEKINKKVTKSGGQAALQMMDDISPVDVSSMPIALRLIIEPMANYDLYWKQNIEKFWMKSLNPGDRVNTRTSYLIKKIGKALNISPIMMQHEIEVLGAGTAKNALWAVDNILVMAGIAQGDIDPKPLGVEKTPVTRRFYGKITEYGDDIDQSVKEIDKQLSKENSKKHSQINQKRITLLYEKRHELMRAKEAIREILATEE